MLGKLSTRLRADLDRYLVDFLDSFLLLFFRKLLQGRIHNLSDLPRGLLLSCEFAFPFHLSNAWAAGPAPSGDPPLRP